MKYALCAENFSVFNSFYNGSDDSVLPFIFLNRDFCENPRVCANVQIIPTVTIVAATNDQYKLLSYTRPSKNNEQRLADKKSIVFGGHIDSVEDVDVETITQEHLRTSKIFSLTKQQFSDMVERVRSRELKEELNLDFSKYQAQKVMQHLIYNTQTEVSSLHIGVNAFYYFDEDVYNQLISDIQVDEKEIASIEEYTIDYEFLNSVKENKQQDRVLETIQQVTKEMNFEDWGTIALQEFFKFHTS
jgi:predicted NUDIX family phosphoesterase